MRHHALSTTTAAASALVATTLLTGGAAVADNNCPPPPINGSSGANAGTSGNGGVSGTAGPNADTNANGTTDANGSNGGGITGSSGTNGTDAANSGSTGANGSANDSADNAAGGSSGANGSTGTSTGGSAGTNGSAGANGSADGGTPMPPPQVAGSHAGGGAPATLLIDCGDRAKVKPDQYTLACGDGANYLTGLHWTHWGKYTARGTGVQHANDCTPDCAHGTFHSYSVIVTVSKRKQLANYNGVSYFSRMRLDYGTVRPGELTHQDYTLTP